MAQITIYLDGDIKRHVKGSGKSASRWVAEAARRRAQAEWPAAVLSLFGSWKDDDFPAAAELRSTLGAGASREERVLSANVRKAAALESPEP